jgi:hypothetical protein
MNPIPLLGLTENDSVHVPSDKTARTAAHSKKNKCRLPHFNTHEIVAGTSSIRNSNCAESSVHLKRRPIPMHPGAMWTFITHKGGWIQGASISGCNNEKNQRHCIMCCISAAFLKSTRRNFQNVQKLHNQHRCCGRPLPVEPHAFFNPFRLQISINAWSVRQNHIDPPEAKLGLLDNFPVPFVWVIQSDVEQARVIFLFDWHLSSPSGDWSGMCCTGISHSRKRRPKIKTVEISTQKFKKQLRLL